MKEVAFRAELSISKGDINNLVMPMVQKIHRVVTYGGDGGFFHCGA